MSEHKPLTAKQASFIQAYADSGSNTHNNATQSAIKAGYSSKTADAAGSRLLVNVRIKEGIARYKAKTAVKLEHNRTIAIDLLHEALAMARTQGNTTAIIAATRELNAISNLHGQTITTKSEDVVISDQDQAAVEEATKALTVRLARNTG